MIKIELEVIEGDAELKMSLENVGVADLQSAICNIEMAKIKLIGMLAGMTDMPDISDKKDK
jgi:hypothetical protein